MVRAGWPEKVLPSDELASVRRLVRRGTPSLRTWTVQRAAATCVVRTGGQAEAVEDVGESELAA